MKIKAYFKGKSTDRITLVINGQKIEDIDLDYAIDQYYGSVNYDCVLEKIEECCLRAGKDGIFAWRKAGGDFCRKKNRERKSAMKENDDNTQEKKVDQQNTTLQDILNKITDIDERKQIERILQQYQNIYQQEIQFLGEGGDTTVFSIGDKVIKFGSNPRHMNVPKTLKAFDTIQYNGNKIMRIMPRLETGNVSREQLQKFYNELRTAGYVWNDIKDDNVGWIEHDGKKELRIIDDIDIWTEEEILGDKYRSVLDFVRGDVAVFEMEYLRTHDPKFNINKLGQYFRDYHLQRRKIYASKLAIDAELIGKERESKKNNSLTVLKKRFFPKDKGKENMRTKNINSTRRVLAEDMKKYVEIILREYGEAIPEERKQFLRGISDYASVIKIEDSGTISMFATNESIILPMGAYATFEFLRRIPGFGINKNHRSYRDGEIVNKNTYFKYIRHVIIKGMSIEEFFRDSLLHETMHFCGAGGADAIREGFTELKIRELAQKHGLIASRCGYPKEVEIASRFQNIVGVDIANQITFASNEREVYRILQENCGKDIAELYFEISHLMNEESKAKYDHEKFGGVFGFIKKASAYSKIDYSEVYKRLESFEKEVGSKKAKEEFFKRVDGKNGAPESVPQVIQGEKTQKPIQKLNPINYEPEQ